MVDKLEVVAAHVVAREVLETVWPPSPPATPLLLLLRLARTLVEAAEAAPRLSSPAPPFSLLTANRPLLRERSKVIPDGLAARPPPPLLPGRSEPELGEAGVCKLEVEQVLDRDALRLLGVRCPVSAGPTFLINPELGGLRRLSMELFLGCKVLGDMALSIFNEISVPLKIHRK